MGIGGKGMKGNGKMSWVGAVLSGGWMDGWMDESRMGKHGVWTYVGFEYVNST